MKRMLKKSRSFFVYEVLQAMLRKDTRLKKKKKRKKGQGLRKGNLKKKRKKKKRVLQIKLRKRQFSTEKGTAHKITKSDTVEKG